jgi:hypothetical protein
MLAPWWLVAIVVAAAAAAALALERLAKPAAPRWSRDLPSTLIVLGSHGLIVAAVLVLTQRVFFAVSAALAGQLLLVLVSNAKVRALREPFVFTDFGLFAQALRHPRLYLPFLGARRTLAVAAVFAVVIYAGLVVEPRTPQAVASAFALALLAAAALWAGLRRSAVVRLDPVEDLHRIGLVASLWLYWLAERRSPTPIALTPWATAAAPARHDLPDLVVVQSESFFDARRLLPAIKPDVLQRFDELRRDALHGGRLHVPAWGANTMRTEFAFLTGIGAGDLGVHRFNPYRHAARRAVFALPAYLQSLGYRTVCIHPHPAAFFQRHRVVPNLGFDEFIDIAAFGGAMRVGPYVADAAVTEKIAEVLASARGPTFVFAITMENHGPLHLERATAAHVRQLYTQPPPAGFDDLTIYLRHLVNADRMLGELAALLRERSREGMLCFFGDHVPSMPDVYDALGFCDAHTDYVVWRPDGERASQRDLAVEELGAVLVRSMLPQAQREPAAGRVR